MQNPHMHPKWKRMADTNQWTMVFGTQTIGDTMPIWVGRIYGVYDMAGVYEVHLLGTMDPNPYRSTDPNLAIMIAEEWDELVANMLV